MSTFSTKAPTSAPDSVRNPAAPMSSGEIRCPERGNQTIGIGRCVENVSCPRAQACEHRESATRLLEIALRPAAQRPGPAGKTKTVAAPRPVARDCEMCPQATKDGAKCCSKKCASLLREMTKRRARGEISSRGHGPDALPFRIGKGGAK